jgi:hypothetical protein
MRNGNNMETIRVVAMRNCFVNLNSRLYTLFTHGRNKYLMINKKYLQQRWTFRHVRNFDADNGIYHQNCRSNYYTTQHRVAFSSVMLS